MHRLSTLLLVFALSLHADELTVEKWAGTPAGRGTYDGDAITAQLNQPASIVRDAAGNLYVADTMFQSGATEAIRRISPNGDVTTFAGPSFISGGLVRSFGHIAGMAMDGRGVLYVADSLFNKIWSITPAGTVSTFLTMSSPVPIAADVHGNVYSSASDCTVSRITPAGIRTVIAGVPNECSSSDGIGSNARLRGLNAFAIDAAGDLWVLEQVDIANSRLRKVTQSGEVTTIVTTPAANGIAVANNGTVYLSLGGVLGAPTRIVTVVDGVVSTFAGSGTRWHRDGTGTSAAFSGPAGIAIDENDNLYVADYVASAIRKITPAAVVTTFIGGTQSAGTDGNRTTARFMSPNALVFDNDGNAFVADNRMIRKVTPAGDVATIAGTIDEFGSTDGTGANARFLNARAITRAADGSLYVTDGHSVRRVTPEGEVTTIAGSAFSSGSTDANGTSARFLVPSGITFANDGFLYVADTGNHTIRRISPSLDVTTFAGAAGSPGATNATGTAARFTSPAKLAFDANSNALLVTTSNTIRKITLPDAVVTTVAGDPFAIATAPVDGTGANARFISPSGIAVQSDGTAVIADSETLRTMTAAGVVTTVAGTYAKPASIDGTGSNARVDQASGITIDATGKIVLAQSSNYALAIATPAGIADIATISPESGAVGSEFQLSTDVTSATSWSWRIVRKPSQSTAALSATNVRNPTFTPDVAEPFTFLLRASSDSGVRYSLVSLWPTSSCTPIASAVATVNSGYETTICGADSGGTASVAVNGGGTLQYQWGWSETPNGTLHPIAGATLASYSVVAADFGGSGTKYLAVIVTPSCGDALRSNPLTVLVQTASITVPNEVFAGMNATASFIEPLDAASYAWSIENGTIVSGSTSSTVTFTAGASGQVTLTATATKDGCLREVQRTIPIIERPAGSTLFYLVNPCRVVDSRSNGGALANLETRTIAVAGKCGIPVGAKSVVMNLAAVSPVTTGFLSLYPSNLAWPGTSTLNYRAGKTRATAGIVSVSPEGHVNVFNNGAPLHFIIDVTGYFQ